MQQVQTMKRAFWLCAMLLTACQHTPVPAPSEHLMRAEAPAMRPPAPLPPPAPATAATPTFSLNVIASPVQQILINLARDAKVNMDVHPAISGVVTLHAIRQPLPALLERIAQQVDIRWRHEGDTYLITPDLPYVESYMVDYVAIEREARGESGVVTSVVSASANQGSDARASQSGTQLRSSSQHRFWRSLLSSLEELLRREDETVQIVTIDREQEIRDTTTHTDSQTRSRKLNPPSANQGAAPENSVTVRDGEHSKLSHTRVQPGQRQTRSEDKTVRVTLHLETGVLAVRATRRQHALVGRFLRQIAHSARRQVLIEATIVEVELTREFETGVDWSRLTGSASPQFVQNSSNLLSDTALRGTVPLDRALGANPVSLLYYHSGSLTSAVKLLEHFGRTRVLSSPKLMALNNQAALLKVVRDMPYFTLKVRRTEGGADKPDRLDYESTLHTVPEGIVLSVQPQISANGEVSLHVRPTITQITGYVSDPAVTLADARVNSPIPRVQVRELESTLRLMSGQIGVLGGLIQDRLDNQSDGLPGLGMLDGIGRLFSHKTDRLVRTELVVFLRPTLVEHPAVHGGDLAGLAGALPDAGFFNGSER